jgi:cell division protein FtsA
LRGGCVNDGGAVSGQGQQAGAVAAKGGIIAALDIGSTKISCLIAEAGSGEAPNLRRDDRSTASVFWAWATSCRAASAAGAIVNVDEAERAIRLAVDAAERMAQRTITEVYVNVSGGRPQSRLFLRAGKRRRGR